MMFEQATDVMTRGTKQHKNIPPRKGNKMILADKIINERKKNGWSQEELAEMLDVSRQSVSKWESAQSVPDLQKILKMAEIFGVSTDYLLKDEIEPDTQTGSLTVDAEPASILRRVTMEEANDFISARKKVLPKVALGVFLCVTSPVILIFMAGLSYSGILKISESAAVAIGLIALFAQIGIAVFLFITHGGKLGKFNYLTEDVFETEYGVDGMAKNKLAEYEPMNTRALTAGVLMCILGCVPLVVTSVLGFSPFVIICMVCLLLLLIGCAVYLFIAVCGVASSYKALLQTDGFTPDEKIKNRKLDNLSRIYWLLITVIYLALSFTTQRWDLTWIIWAVSGVLFALIRVVAASFIRTDD